MEDINQRYPIAPNHSYIRKDERRILRDNIKNDSDTIVFIERSLFHDLDGRTMYILYAYSSTDNQNLTLIDYYDFQTKKHKERLTKTDIYSGIHHIIPEIITGQYTELQNLAFKTDTGDDDIIRILVILKNGNAYHLFKHLSIPNPDYLLFEKEMEEIIYK